LPTSCAKFPERGPSLSTTRDHNGIDDAARGLADIALGEAKGAFNLGTGRSIAAGEVARLALDIADETARSVIAMRHDGPVSSISLDISQTARAFGWRPLVSLQDGIHRLLSRRG
jgi:nucleoside-diphosphate-sugar epimerase